MACLPTPSEIETQAKAAGLTINELCRRAGIAQSTFWRWKGGHTQPRLDVCQRLMDAVREASA